MSSARQLWLRAFLPFAAGYFLSYLLRTTNAVIAPELTQDLGLSAADLGLLTGAYFFAFGVFQLPLGLLLDRYGARRVEALLLLFAAAGCVLFGLGHSLTALVVGRALIGLGVSACLMAALKYLFQSFAAERHASLTAAMMTAGGLGAIGSSLPLTALLPLVGWRGAFLGIAGLSLLVTALILTVPEQTRRASQESMTQQIASLLAVFRRRIYWRYGLQMAFFTGGNMAFQGLWAVPWLMTVNGHNRAVAAQHLFQMGGATLAGYIAVALFATRLARRGISPIFLLASGSLLTLTAESLIALDALPSPLLWLAFGLAISTSNLGYGLLAAHFPASLSGRVTTAVNLLAFAGAFSIQWGFGAGVDALAALGWSPADAYRGSFAVLILAQAGSFAFFLRGPRAVAGKNAG